ncbi:PREDICTED: uncharacterized protein LOC106806345 [Priapulus caudatus]|uniref:Uncharacterized protein LOC106806345 n=1 Tax=Priapulus caudatus TaxID=37621 RepID=A0ABM1DUW8_PRICU|nr:PREDICTED: uncharacterized protein LOC106806345 [Priapulus caudatus]
MEMLQKNLASIFNADQVEALGLQQGCTSVKWSPETIRSSVEMRAMVGADGYEYLRKRNFPLPSYRTLCTRLKHVGEAKPGLQHIIVDWNGEDIELVIPEEHAAAIALEDDMQLMDAVQLDSTV